MGELRTLFEPIGDFPNIIEWARYQQWVNRRKPLSDHGWHATQRVCPTCSGTYTPGQYRAHLRGWMHNERRGWWK